MRTIARAFLASVLLVTSLLLLLSPPVVGLVNRLAAGGSLAPRLAMSILVVLAAIASNAIALALVPAASRTQAWRRALHWLALAGVAVGGFAIFATVDWPEPAAGSRVLDFSASWPYVALGGFWFVAHLILAAIIRPEWTGEEPIPRRVRDRLAPGEHVLSCVRESRFLAIVTPDYLVATDNRVITYRPTNLGVTCDIDHLNYNMIGNIEEDSGMLFSSIKIYLIFKDGVPWTSFTRAPKRRAQEFVRTVQGQKAKLSEVAPHTPYMVAAASRS